MRDRIVYIVITTFLALALIHGWNTRCQDLQSEAQAPSAPVIEEARPDPPQEEVITVPPTLAPSMQNIEEWSISESLSINADEGLVMGMVKVDGGCFEMVSRGNDTLPEGTPSQKVCLDTYYIDAKEVTQDSYYEVMGSNPSRFKGDDLPVDSVKWEDAAQYCRLVAMRLPTEAEWEYAASSRGVDNIWAGANTPGALASFAWYKSNSGGSTHTAGSLQPNSLGLYDMSGNVREWVQQPQGHNVQKRRM